MPHILASDYAVDILVKDLHLRHRSRDANCVGNSAVRAGPRHKPPAHDTTRSRTKAMCPAKLGPRCTFISMSD